MPSPVDGDRVGSTGCRHAGSEHEPQSFVMFGRILLDEL
jgi:hypothetical protein